MVVSVDKPELLFCFKTSAFNMGYIITSVHSPGNINGLDPVLNVPELVRMDTRYYAKDTWSSDLQCADCSWLNHKTTH